MAAPNLTDVGGSSAAVAGSGGVVAAVRSAVLSSPVPEWNGEAVLLRDFATKRQVPGFARVVKGSYMTLGVSKFPLSRQHTDVYIHSVKVGVKVLAHCLKRVELPVRKGRQNSRLVPSEQRLTIPISYQGWFELLSEDGKASRPITSVHELARHNPKRCLVRENIKAYLSTGADRQPTSFDKTKIIPAGEQLLLCGLLTLPGQADNIKAGRVSTLQQFDLDKVKVKMLRCRDSKGDEVYLSFDQKGLFTPIAGQQDFTGVFTIRDIVRRLRLPLTVKLAHGVRPRVDPSKFTGLIRLDWVYTEETAFVCPLEKNHVRLMPVPCDADVHLVAATNQEALMDSELCRSIQAKCSRMVANYHNTIHLIVNLPESVTRTQNRNSRSSNIFSAPLQPDPSPSPAHRGHKRSKSREDLLMDEIDNLYGYVRDGGALPAMKTKFTYDSDEESYWEEPAYEPLDDFRVRLKAMETGAKVTYPPQYTPTDPGQLKGLVEGGEGAAGSGDVTGAGSEGMYGVMATGPPDESSSSTATPEEPPPLPPRRFELASAAAATDSPPAPTPPTPTPPTAHTPPNTQSPEQSLSARRTSAPVTQTTPLHRNPPTSVSDNSSIPPRRVSTSDSDLAPFPTSPTAARPHPSLRQQSMRSGTSGDAKPDWKERLRQFNNLGEGKDKEGSSSNSSGSTPHSKGGNRLARDFKDSDISSRAGNKSSSSSGNVRKRMQTLYL